MITKPMTVNEMKKVVKILKTLNKELKEDNDKFFQKKSLQNRKNIV